MSHGASFDAPWRNPGTWWVERLRETQRLTDETAMEIAPIKNDRDHRRILQEIEGLMHAERNTPEGDRLDLLVTLVEAWEAKHYSLDSQSGADH
jgi:hypothetical protein